MRLSIDFLLLILFFSYIVYCIVSFVYFLKFKEPKRHFRHSADAPKSSSLCSRARLRPLFFELRNAILIQSPSETASEPILKRFWVQKWSKNRPKINQKSMSVFDFVFCFIFYPKIHVTSKPRTSKINKNLLVF